MSRIVCFLLNLQEHHLNAKCGDQIYKLYILICFLLSFYLFSFLLFIGYTCANVFKDTLDFGTPQSGREVYPCTHMQLEVKIVFYHIK